ncbi:hypothetical protein CTheo_8525 [Ceratobasidium theobromae]|uniref:Uncharacterized protein n=1 Tax=Ceratobasidium theobromae TaxID=1582974 RepID=A0A5N5Q8N2_9AGAM|nr:hypothetical protein CTheo_8525 [Ceratobasidium theobromae]
MPSSVGSQSLCGDSPENQARDNPRRRRRSTDAEHEDDDQSPPPAKRTNVIVVPHKRRAADEYGITARLITRVHAANWEPYAVVNAGISLLALDADDEDAAEAEIASASERKRVLYDIFKMLCDRIPGFVDSTDWDSVRSRLDEGRIVARTEDNHVLKINLPKWKNCEWDPPLDPGSKHNRGLAHPQCAMLLAPISVDWGNEEARNRFITLYDPPMTAAQLWPAFMYKDYKGDVNDLSKGLLRSAIMVRAAKAIIFPPSVANAEDEPDHQSNRRTKADTYGMDGVTPSFLAYVAVALRFSLSSEKYFHNQGGLFNYNRFYNDIVNYLNDPVCKPETNELIKWWNTRLFKPKHTVVEEEPESMVARLRRQAEARRNNGDE